ncbi:uncharacterized protein LOC144439815 [Glandiceps talaboti]
MATHLKSMPSHLMSTATHLMSTATMMPSYRQKLKCTKPKKISVLQWSPDAIEKLRACLDCTNWDELFEDDANKTTEVITDYINFCVDVCLPTKTLKRYPNNKPWFDSSLKHILQLKQAAYREGNAERTSEVGKQLITEIYKKKVEYKHKLENQFSTNNTRDTWRGLQTITDYKSSTGKLTVTNEKAFAEELNEFYARFDRDENEKKLTNELLLLDNEDENQEERIVVNVDEVVKQFKSLNVRKTAGPDNITGKLLKECCTQLAPIFSRLFQLSIDTHTVPHYWKKSCIIPIPKIPRPTKNNDFRPVALTSIPMKCLERILLKYLVSQTSLYQDPLQFAYRQHRSTEDAVLSILHTITQHLDASNTSVRVLFVDFSSAFNTISPNLLIRKLRNMAVNQQLIRWVADFLTRRMQFVKVNSTSSGSRMTNTGSPQGSVISPSLFTIFTSDCNPINTNSNDKLYKFADDKALVGLITANRDTTYREEVDRLVTCNPCYVNGNTSYVDGNPSHVNRNPSYVNGNTSYVNGNPSYVNSNPCYVNGNTSYVDGNPSHVNRNPSYVNGNPSYVKFGICTNKYGVIGVHCLEEQRSNQRHSWSAWQMRH